jgi:hypothetical protein
MVNHHEENWGTRLRRDRLEETKRNYVLFCPALRWYPKIDQLYRCIVSGQVFGGWKLRCHLRIYFPHPEQQTVLISDMGCETGWFIPYKVEQLANHIVKEFQLDPAALVWIEHYSPNVKKPTCSEFSQVTFDWKQRKASNPRWESISDADAQAFAGEALYLAEV